MRSLDHGSFGNAYLLLTLAPLTWGANAVAGKIASQEWLPFSLTCLRWGCVFLVLLPFAWRQLQREFYVVRKHALYMLLLGGVGQGGFNLCLYYALNHISAINASIEQSAMPILIMLFNFIFLHQRVSYAQMLGLCITIAGVVVTATSGDPRRFLTGDLNHGDLVMILGAAFYAAYTFGLRWRPPIGWMSFLIAMSAGGFLLTLPFALWELTNHFQDVELQIFNAPLPSMHGWLVLAFIVVFPSILGQLFYARGVDLIGANRAGLFINLVPVFGSLLAVLVLAERFQWHHAIGLILVLSGIAMAERSVKRWQ